MRILVLGSGGREHALIWKLKQDSNVKEIIVAPGNGGTAMLARNIDADLNDINALVSLAKEVEADLVIPGPELPLVGGVVDAMSHQGIKCFGPDKWCAQIEGSKSFAKEIMSVANVPTAKYKTFDNFDSAREYVKLSGTPIVIKADGLAAGKGVIVANSEEEANQALSSIMVDKDFGNAGHNVVIEECLVGEEVSLLALCDGENALPLPSAQDHKPAFDGDKGPNTGGMGAYSPAPILPDSALDDVADIVIRPILREMKKRGHPFKGILYAGLMMTNDGPKVLEYNARFGDPECEPLMMRIKSDLLPILLACIDGTLNDLPPIEISKEAALGVVISAQGYPGKYTKLHEICGIEEAQNHGAVVFHAGTTIKDGKLLSNGGRVLCVTALGKTLHDAREHAYDAVHSIKMDGSFHRTDIGMKGIKHLEHK